MTIIRIGCAGWAYPEWKRGEFYPKSLPSNQFLQFYSQYFNFVEINTTFYHLPKDEVIQHWNSSTPDYFSYSIKVWQNISHKKEFANLDEQISQFFKKMALLKSKISAFLLQFPPSFRFSEPNFEKLQFMMNQFPKWGKFFIEFRNSTWFDSLAISAILNHPRFHLVTSFIPYTEPYFSEKQHYQYIRMIGDRTLKRFDHIQRPQTQALTQLKSYLTDLRSNRSIEEIFVIFNNHFRGFAPYDVISLLKDLALPYKEFKRNKSLLDYF
jgi:uncharacterized protein YecE (DUF72 family)